MAIEYGAVGAAKALFDFCKSAYALARGRRAALSNVQIVECRAKWKRVFDQRLALCQRDNLGRDVTVRDIKRLDEYPNIKDDEKGISPWFRAGLVGTNERSVLLLLRWGSLNAEAIEFMQLEGIARHDAKGNGNVALIGLCASSRLWTSIGTATTTILARVCSCILMRDAENHILGWPSVGEKRWTGRVTTKSNGT